MLLMKGVRAVIRELSQDVLLMRGLLLVGDILVIIDVHSSGNRKCAITKRLIKV